MRQEIPLSVAKQSENLNLPAIKRCTRSTAAFATVRTLLNYTIHRVPSWTIEGFLANNFPPVIGLRRCSESYIAAPVDESLWEFDFFQDSCGSSPSKPRYMLLSKMPLWKIKTPRKVIRPII
jgi:hypothetical protein